MPAQSRGEERRGEGVRTKQTIELVPRHEDGVDEHRLDEQVVLVLEVRAKEPPLRITRQGRRKAGIPGGELQDGTAPDIVLNGVLTKPALKKTAATVSLGEAAVSAPPIPHFVHDN